MVGAVTLWDGQQGVTRAFLRSRKRASFNQCHRDSGSHSISQGRQGSRPKRNTEYGSATFSPAGDALPLTVIKGGPTHVRIPTGLEAWLNSSYSETRKGTSSAFVPLTSKSGRRLASSLKNHTRYHLTCRKLTLANARRAFRFLTHT